jgi:S1-C subfamily serine protease
VTEQSDAPVRPTITPATAPAATAPAANALEDLISRLMPAVVRVQTDSGYGTGFFVRPDTILTNVHVVQGNALVTIRRANGTTLPARVEKTAPEVDIAVLHIDAPIADQPTIPLGSGLQARAGQEVVALGSPLGLQNTVTRGIVSAIRDVGGVTLVQTDAAINPGNSGGPLVDRNGDAIGITSLGMRSAVAQGLSFAVAIDHAADLLAGKRAVAAGTPSANLNEALRESRSGVSEASAMRVQATRAYEQAIVQIARRADALDNYWRRFRAACYEGRVSGPFEREWFALFDARAMQGAVAPGCGSSFGEVQRMAADIRGEVLALEEGARRADVYPGDRRDVRRKYRLDYPGWDR